MSLTRISGVNGINFSDIIASNPLLVTAGVALAGWGVYELTSPRKTSIGKIDSNTLLLVGGIGIAAVLLLSRKATTSTTTPVYLPSPVNTTGPNAWSAITAIGPSLISNIFDLFGDD